MALPACGPHLLFECVGLAERGGATLSQSDTLKCFDRDPGVAILHPNRKNVRERYTVAGVYGIKIFLTKVNLANYCHHNGFFCQIT